MQIISQWLIGIIPIKLQKGTMPKKEKIIHYVPGHWNGQAYVKAVCNEEVSCEEASSLFTNCPNCKIEWRRLAGP